MNLKPTHKYDDIIDLPHHQSPRRAGMPMTDRAAQFAPFAALTGYEDVIEERLQILGQNCRHFPAVTVVYFQPDLRKTGGSYVTATGCVKRVDPCSQLLQFTDGRQISLATTSELNIENPHSLLQI